MNTTWRALANPTRRRLIELLSDAPRTTGELCAAFGASRFAVMKHLRVLERVGLVDVRPDGRKRWNTLNPRRLLEIGDRWPGAPGRPLSPPLTAMSPGAGGAAGLLQVFIDAVPWKVFDALTTGVAAWWGAPYLRWEEASNLVLEPQPGGRFYEEWGHRQGAVRGVVTAIRQDDCLELAGALFGQVHGRLSFSLEPREGGTLLAVAWDQVPADAIDDLIRRRLKAFVETGARTGVAQ